MRGSRDIPPRGSMDPALRADKGDGGRRPGEAGAGTTRTSCDAIAGTAQRTGSTLVVPVGGSCRHRPGPKTPPFVPCGGGGSLEGRRGEEDPGSCALARGCDRRIRAPLTSGAGGCLRQHRDGGVGAPACRALSGQSYGGHSQPAGTAHHQGASVHEVSGVAVAGASLHSRVSRRQA